MHGRVEPGPVSRLPATRWQIGLRTGLNRFQGLTRRKTVIFDHRLVAFAKVAVHHEPTMVPKRTLTNTVTTVCSRGLLEQIPSDAVSAGRPSRWRGAGTSGGPTRLRHRRHTCRRTTRNHPCQNLPGPLCPRHSCKFTVNWAIIERLPLLLFPRFRHDLTLQPLPVA